MLIHRARLGRRATVTGGLAVSLLWVGAGAASAHITVGGSDLAQGGSDALISFRVPDESDSASTIELKVQLPSATPIASVLVQPHAGWTATQTTTELATPVKTDDGEISRVVSQIDWKATSTAAGIKPGEFDQFVIIAGLLPKAPLLTFKAIQTYSDGTTTSWIEEAAPGSNAQPEHPAPVLTLPAAVTSASSAPAAVTSASSAPSVGVSATPAATTRAAAGASAGSVTLAIVIAALGVVLGAAGLATALATRRRAS
jgi:uncharacterized protein YcnI